MGKIRHRTFEIFDFIQEAFDSLTSKSARKSTHEVDPSLWEFRYLNTAMKPCGMIHVTFKQRDAEAESESLSELGKDFAHLAELLTNGSRVLLDFEGLPAFDAAAITRLSEFNTKLQSKGSRIVLCNLEPPVHASFLPQVSTNDRHRA